MELYEYVPSDTKLNPTFKAKWLAALRSGDYEQAGATLRGVPADYNDDPLPGADAMFCCLGVACDLINPDWNANGETVETANGSIYVYDWYDTDEEYVSYSTTSDLPFLPDIEVSTPGERTMTGSEFTRRVGSQIATMNDKGKTFEEIADCIEANL